MGFINYFIFFVRFLEIYDYKINGNGKNNKKMKTLILIGFVLFFSINLKAQGCSDAGFCTVNSIKTDENTDTLKTIKNQFKFGLTFGDTKYKVSIINPYVEYTRYLNKKLSASFKVFSSVHHGDLTTTQSISDAILTLNYKLPHKIKVVGGVKLPFNKSNISDNGVSLPMAYQTSLGTFDIILGANYNYKSFVFTAAYQQPLTQNRNTFLSENYPDDINYSKYISTNGYQRSGDVLIRLTYYSQFKNKKLLLISSLLPIYHLRNDTYINKNGEKISIVGSEGLTLNLNAFMKYKIDENNSLEFSAGAPVISRKNRPDGLSQLSIGIEYLVNF